MPPCIARHRSPRGEAAAKSCGRHRPVSSLRRPEGSRRAETRPGAHDPTAAPDRPAWPDVLSRWTARSAARRKSARPRGASRCALIKPTITSTGGQLRHRKIRRCSRSNAFYCSATSVGMPAQACRCRPLPSQPARSAYAQISRSSTQSTRLPASATHADPPCRDQPHRTFNASCSQCSILLRS